MEPRNARQHLNIVACAYRDKLTNLARDIEKELERVEAILCASGEPSLRSIGSTPIASTGWETAVSVIRYASRIDALMMVAFDDERKNEEQA